GNSPAREGHRPQDPCDRLHGERERRPEGNLPGGRHGRLSRPTREARSPRGRAAALAASRRRGPRQGRLNDGRWRRRARTGGNRREALNIAQSYFAVITYTPSQSAGGGFRAISATMR